MDKYEKCYIIKLPDHIGQTRYGNSSIYHYKENNLHLEEITNITYNAIGTTSKKRDVTSILKKQVYWDTHVLCLCYDLLIKNKMSEIIFEIINNYSMSVNSHEMFAICLAAIINAVLPALFLRSVRAPLIKSNLATSRCPLEAAHIKAVLPVPELAQFAGIFFSSSI